jgi:hypothetical protein
VAGVRPEIVMDFRIEAAGIVVHGPGVVPFITA